MVVAARRQGHGKSSITKERRDDLYAYMWGIQKKLKCHLYRIGGVEDHVHILTSFPPTLALSAYIEKMKTGATNWIRRENVYRNWPGWQDGYGGFTVSRAERDGIIEYIKSQEEHHQKISFLDEYRRLLTEAGIEFDERYLA